MEFKYYLKQQLEKHKLMQPRDIVKMCYQAAFGAEHLLADIDAAEKYFYAEYDSVESKEGELYEELSSDICRINMTAWKTSGMPAEWLFNMFVHSASVPHGSRELFLGYLQEVEAVLEGTEVMFAMKEWQEYLANYKAEGMSAVHHSDIYRENEKPAYRIVNRRYLNALPILKAALALPENNGVKVIAIDGRAAAGKSTMAENLRAILGAELIHMDDFFLPPTLRNKERLAEQGGNVHYERFCEEVLPYVANESAFSYRIFDCSKMDYNGERQVAMSPWRVVEGSYSHHPKFGDYADLKVFLDVDEEEQMRRIVARDGEEMAEMFRNCWIPMEEIYFKNQAHGFKRKLIELRN